MTTHTISLDNDNLRMICIRNNYFTAGDCDMYRKLFQANDDGASLDDLATIIWVCSSGVSRREVLEALNREALTPISISHLTDTLRDAAWGDAEIAIITEALRTHQDVNSAYRILGE